MSSFAQASGRFQWQWEHEVPLRWLVIDQYTADQPQTAVAVCADIEGLFGSGPAVLLGCRPEPVLRAALQAPEAHRVSGSIFMVTPDGTPISMVGPRLEASVTGVRASGLGAGLLDVTFDNHVYDAKPVGAREIWESWRAGPPVKLGGWTGYDRNLRDEWSGAALGHRRYTVPDQPAGSVFHLDGRHVTDLEGFYCAIGEAINGPGGYFGWTADALHDCLCGGWGTTTPFRLVWHDSAVARAHLIHPGSLHTLDKLVEWLTEDGVEVDLR